MTDPYDKSDMRCHVPLTRASMIAGLKIMDAVKWFDFVQVYAPWIFQRALAQIGDKGLAADISQEVFIAVAGGIERFKPDGQESFRRWLSRITARRVADFYRDLGNRRVFTNVDMGLNGIDDRGGATEIGFGLADGRQEEPGDETMSEDKDEAEKRALYQRAFALLRPRLKPKTLEAVRLVLVERLSPDEAAEALQMSRSAVYSARSQFLRRLREIAEGMSPGTLVDDSE